MKKSDIMKKPLFLFLILFLIHCHKDFSPLGDVSPETKYFDPQKLSLLKLDSLENFWQGDTITHKSNFITVHFNRHPSFLDAIRYSTKKRGAVSVSVFKNQKDAIRLMKERIHAVASVIYNGDSDEKIKDIWWYTRGLPPAIFINHNNTIVETYIIDYNYDKVKDNLIETALEISKRVEELSE